MLLSDLIEALQRVQEAYDEDDPEVRIMEQENYPFECEIDALVDLKEIHDVNLQRDKPKFTPAARHGWNCGPRPEHVLYILVGKQLGYGTKAAWLAAGGCDG